MKLSTISTWLLYSVVAYVEAAPYKNNTETTASSQIDRLQKRYQKYIEATIKTRESGCNSDNIVYRQEWGALSPQSRIDYTNAVQCLHEKPAVSSTYDVPGARNRFDDFVATHITKTTDVHFSGLFFHFHRYLTWLYEKALQEECGYKGTQPYWDWSLSWQDPRQSTVFDGSPTSLGSNGKPTPHGPTNISAFGISLQVPPATGGGCLYSGPFTNFTVNLGPVAFANDQNASGLDYNPRCLSRDLSPEWAKQTKFTDVASLLSSCDDLNCFGTTMEALDGVHAGGHFLIGGVNIDAFSAAGDPIFYLHHAQVDRLWTIWQNQNPSNRTRQVYGTSSSFNAPPSPNVTLNTDVDFGILAPQQPIENLISSIDGPFCYMYL